MTQKTISIPEDLYRKLKKRKGDLETFPELIERLLDEEKAQKNKHRIKDLEGAFGIESEEWEKIEKELYKDRLRASSRQTISFED